MSDNTERIIWFAIGAAVGAGVALLYAPQSGRATRRYIARKAEEGKEAIEESGKDIYEKGRDLFEQGRKLVDEAADLFERGKKAVGA